MKVLKDFTITAMAIAAGAFLLNLIAVGAAPVETSMSIRSTGQMAEHFDQPDLIKRVNLVLIAKSIALIASLSYTACNAPIIPAVQATICAVAIVAGIGIALSTYYRGLQGRDLALIATNADGSVTLDHNGIQYVHNYPGQPDKNIRPLDRFASLFNGALILAAYNPCETTGCMQVHYSNQQHPKAGLLHRLSVSPRRSFHSASVTNTKRQIDQTIPVTADSDGSMVFGDYVFRDENTADEVAFGYDGGFPNHLETAVGSNDVFTNHGYICLTVEDGDDSNAIASQGYISISQDENIADPDNEDAYIDGCT